MKSELMDVAYDLNTRYFQAKRENKDYKALGLRKAARMIEHQFRDSDVCAYRLLEVLKEERSRVLGRRYDFQAIGLRIAIDAVMGVIHETNQNDRGVADAGIQRTSSD